MTGITLQHIVKIYPFAKAGLFGGRKRKELRREQMNSPHRTNEGVIAVQDLSLEIRPGELLVLLGPSGCGKTSLLRMIAGLEEATLGEVYFGDKLMNYTPPNERNLAMIFQNYSLYPHLTVAENIAFTLTTKRIPREEIDVRVRETAQLLGLTKKLEAKPKDLSGGEAQRVAIGRALVRQPDIFLMDEPFSNLDAKLRAQMQAQVSKLHRQLDTTFVYVTHDQMEAMMLGDRIAVMDNGILQQVGTPREVFRHPDNLFVAGFVGTPKMNLIADAKLLQQGTRYSVAMLGSTVPLSPEKCRILSQREVGSQTITAGIRPVHLAVESGGVGARLRFSENMGAESYLHLEVDGLELLAVVPSERTQDGSLLNGQTVGFGLDGEKLHLFHAKTGENLLGRCGGSGDQAV